MAASVRDKCLLIGKQVKLKGEVPACEKVLVEGEAELQLSGCRSLQVGTLGVFRGRAEVAEADIAGLFEGEIVARERLAVRSTARMSGKISYGQIVIEAGGRVSGEMIGLQPPAGTLLPAAAETRPEEAAAQGDGPAATAAGEPEPQEPPASVRLSVTADDRP
ncbi:MAG: polymer-forming cytoskeletal protein [Rhodospirillales bacterium]